MHVLGGKIDGMRDPVSCCMLAATILHIILHPPPRQAPGKRVFTTMDAAGKLDAQLPCGLVQSLPQQAALPASQQILCS